MSAQNIYRTKQNFNYDGDDWWSWSVWIDASPENISKISYVVYTLHSTFNNPVRKIKDRSTHFRLDSEGWGVFTIYIKIVLLDNSEILLEHELELKYPDGSINIY